MAKIAALIDAGELRLDISERELLRDTAAIHERAEAGDGSLYTVESVYGPSS